MKNEYWIIRQFFKIYLILLCTSYASHAEVFPDADFSDHVEDIHKYLDKLLKEATINFRENKLEPIRLPDTLKTFRKKVGFITFSGGLSTYNGELHGLSSIYRSGEVVVTLSPDSGETLTVEADLAFDNINIRTDSRIWFAKLGKRFSMGAKVKHLRGTVQLELPLDPGGTPRVTNLLIRKIGRITLDFKRLGPLNWILEGFGFVYMNTVKKFTRERVERIILEEVNKEISKVQFPKLMDLVAK